MGGAGKVHTSSTPSHTFSPHTIAQVLCFSEELPSIMALNNESSLSNLGHRLEVLAHRLTHVDRLLSALLLGAERAVATDVPGLLPPRGAPLHHALAARHGGTSAAAGGREDGGRHHGDGRGYPPGYHAQPSPLPGDRRGGGHPGGAFAGVGAAGAGSGSGSFGHGHAAAPPPPSPLASPAAGRTGRTGVLAEANFGGDLTITIHGVRGLAGMSKSAQLFVKVRRSI